MSSLSIVCVVSRALHVHDRRFTADRDGFRERANTEIRVDGRHEAPFQPDPVALERVEAAQRERHGVDAWPKIDDAVLTGSVGDDRPRLLDERRARRLDRDARQNRARRISCDARDGRLCKRRRRRTRITASTVPIRTSMRMRNSFHPLEDQEDHQGHEVHEDHEEPERPGQDRVNRQAPGLPGMTTSR